MCCTHSQKRKRSAFVFLKKWQHTGIFFYRILYGGFAVVWQFSALCCQNQLLLLLNQASVATTALFFAVWICICVCGVWQKCSWQLWAAAAAVWTWIEFVQSDFFSFFLRNGNLVALGHTSSTFAGRFKCKFFSFDLYCEMSWSSLVCLTLTCTTTAADTIAYCD